MMKSICAEVGVTPMTTFHEVRRALSFEDSFDGDVTSDYSGNRRLSHNKDHVCVMKDEFRGIDGWNGGTLELSYADEPPSVIGTFTLPDGQQQGNASFNVALAPPSAPPCTWEKRCVESVGRV